MEKKHPLDVPINAESRYLHGINIRLEILIEQVSSLVDHLAKKDAVAVTKQVVETPVVETVATQVRRKK